MVSSSGVGLYGFRKLQKTVECFLIYCYLFIFSVGKYQPIRDTKRITGVLRHLYGIFWLEFRRLSRGWEQACNEGQDRVILHFKGFFMERKGN